MSKSIDDTLRESSWHQGASGDGSTREGSNPYGIGSGRNEERPAGQHECYPLDGHFVGADHHLHGHQTAGTQGPGSGHTPIYSLAPQARDASRQALAWRVAISRS